MKTCKAPILKQAVIHDSEYFCTSPQPITDGIEVVAKDPTRADRDVIIVHQFHLHSSIYDRYISFFFSEETASLILRTQTPHPAVLLW